MTRTKAKRFIFALSHCWSPDEFKPIVTITRNLLERQLSIHFEDLPASFKDAMTVTRHLSFDYLWIDSLCILQDSVKDWSLESARIGAMYSNATLTISATCAAHSRQGFLRERKPIEPSCELVTEEMVQSYRSVFLRPSGN
jgi:hypothetical protein